MVESETREPAGVTRGQNVVHVTPLDWSALPRLIGALVERIDVARPEPQLLVVTPDTESAASAAAAIVGLVNARGARVLSATMSPRAARLLKTAPPHVVVGAPAELTALLQSSALKPESVRAIALAWLDTILETPEASLQENQFAELPKDGARVVLASALSPAYEALIERYARRARRESEPAGEPGPALSAEYVAAPVAGRAAALRRLLDALDLPAAVLYARDEAVRDDAERVARALGYPAESVRVASSAADAAGGEPIVLLDLPATREEMRALAGAAGRRIYAVVQPSQLASLRALLGSGTVTPIALVDAAERARGKDAAIRASLRDVLTSSDVRREVLAIEPLLSEFDGIEIAAAALRLIEQQRPVRPAAPAAAAGPMTALFVNVGERDGVRAQELVAAVTSSSGIPGSQIGKVEVRDNHSIVEVAAPVAELVAGKLTGSVVRGRRMQARVDQPREARGERRGPPRSDRGDRGAPRGDRSGPRGGDRGERGDRGDRFDRPGRPGPRTGGAPRGGRDAGAKRPHERDDRRPPRAAAPPRNRRDET
jgi:ATP-dependent RNA helicase DeaD